MEPVISVIVPVYNVEKYVARCIDSILKQTYTNLEILLVDDGSLDHSGQICEEYRKIDARIQVIHQENGGLSAARNTGIEVATGEYFAFVDSDDFLSPRFIEALLQACIQTKSDLAQCRWETVSKDILSEAVPAVSEYKTYSNREALAQMYQEAGAYFIVAWNKLYKRELFDQIRYPVGRIHEDEATTYRLIYQTKKVVVLDQALYGYFTAEESITRNRFNKKRLDWEWAVAGRMQFLAEQGENTLLQSTRKAYLDGCIALYFQCKKHLLESVTEQKDLKKKIRAAYSAFRKEGGYPLRTVIGYQLFLLFPTVYKKMIAHINPEVWNE